MKYYVTADTHGFYTILKDALDQAGFFTDQEDHKLIILGDRFDRGNEENELQKFILQLMGKDEVILIRGNHEDLFCELVNEDHGEAYEHHIHNGTYKTALWLTGYNLQMALNMRGEFCDAAKRTPFYKLIIPSMLDYFETDHYIFTHGWIPCFGDRKAGYRYDANWRNACSSDWKLARWINSMDAALTCTERKTLICGHWHCSYGHSYYELKGSEFGEDADFSPYYGSGIIALDACTAVSGRVNVIILEDEPLAAVVN